MAGAQFLSLVPVVQPRRADGGRARHRRAVGMFGVFKSEEVVVGSNPAAPTNIRARNRTLGRFLLFAGSNVGSNGR